MDNERNSKLTLQTSADIAIGHKIGEKEKNNAIIMLMVRLLINSNINKLIIPTDKLVQIALSKFIENTGSEKSIIKNLPRRM